MRARALLAGAFLLASRAAAAPPRAIVLISIDTLRRDAVSAALTPRLEAFAEDAAVFEDATSQATWTLPSHASMLTSRYPSGHGAGGPSDRRETWRPISGDARPLAGLLAGAGYRTVALVSSPVLDARWGFARGFDEYRSGDRGPEGDERTLRAAVRELERSDGRKLFLFVHSNIVHAYVRQKAPPLGPPYRCPIVTADMLPGFAGRPVPREPDPKQCRRERGAYERAVSCMDLELGRLLDALKGPAGKDALVVLTADHGEALCESHPRTPLRGHGFAGYADQVDVPLIVRLPGGAAAGLRVTAPAREIDIAATILDAAGVARPAGFRGRSLLPLLAGRTLPPAPSLAEGDDWRSVRLGGREYIRRSDGSEELYRLERGRPEGENLARRGEDAAPLRAALAELARGGVAAPRALASDRRLDRALEAEGYRR